MTIEPTRADVRTLTEVRRVIERAENAGDPEPIIAFMADAVAVMVPDLPVQEGKTAAAAFLRNLLPGLLGHFDRRIAYDSDEGGPIRNLLDPPYILVGPGHA